MNKCVYFFLSFKIFLSSNSRKLVGFFKVLTNCYDKNNVASRRGCVEH